MEPSTPVRPIHASHLPDEHSPLLRDLMTGRLVQLIARLQPLSDWQGHGIWSVSVIRWSVDCRELEALGAALGASCQRLHIRGKLEEEARQGTPRWFPHVGTNYTLGQAQRF
jgi:hypothetical protein